MPQTYFRLSMTRMRSARIATALLALLSLALLGAQWTGVQHRVAHALIAEASVGQTAATPDNDEGPDPAHSCTLFDAAALGATLYSAFIRPVCLRAVMSRLRQPETTSWQANPFRHFSPRAPPLP